MRGRGGCAAASPSRKSATAAEGGESSEREHRRRAAERTAVFFFLFGCVSPEILKRRAAAHETRSVAGGGKLSCTRPCNVRVSLSVGSRRESSRLPAPRQLCSAWSGPRAASPLKRGHPRGGAPSMIRCGPLRIRGGLQRTRFPLAAAPLSSFPSPSPLLWRHRTR